MRQSRLTVRPDTPLARAISSILQPPKKRGSTSSLSLASKTARAFVCLDAPAQDLGRSQVGVFPDADLRIENTGTDDTCEQSDLQADIKALEGDFTLPTMATPLNDFEIGRNRTLQGYDIPVHEPVGSLEDCAKA